MYMPLKLRTRLARQYAAQVQGIKTAPKNTDGRTEEKSSELVSSIVNQLSPDMIIDTSDGIIVTDVGFVTMALLPYKACRRGDLLVIPGVDDRAQWGHLVLRKGFVPYHSVAWGTEQAALEAIKAHEDAEKLVEFFGSRQNLKKAALATPWYVLSRHEDVAAAGLCQWGSDCFLRRVCMYHIGIRIGLPRFMLRLAGSYGNRVTAATLRRHTTLSTSTHHRRSGSYI